MSHIHLCLCATFKALSLSLQAAARPHLITSRMQATAKPLGNKHGHDCLSAFFILKINARLIKAL